VGVTVLPSLGLHDDVDEVAYHGDSRSLSSTQAKTVLHDGPKEFREAVREHRDAYDFGSVVHALVLGVGEYTVLDFDSWRTKEARTVRDLYRSAGVAPILERDFVKAEAMRDAVFAHPVAAELLAEGRPEVSIWATDPATGVLMRGRIDWLRGGTNIDLKTSSGRVDSESFAGTALRFHYGMQAAWYMRLLHLNGVEPTPPIWVVAGKRPPYEVEVLRPAQDLIDFSTLEVDRALALYARCVETDTWPSAGELGADGPDPLGYLAHSETVSAVWELPSAGPAC